MFTQNADYTYIVNINYIYKYIACITRFVSKILDNLFYDFNMVIFFLLKWL